MIFSVLWSKTINFLSLMKCEGIYCKINFLKKSRYVVFSILIALVWHTKSISQIKNFTKDNGLTSSVISCTHIDAKGIVWIGTNDGLNAYAGSKWYSITSIEDSKTGKQEILGRIETIFEDSKGQIWVSVMDKIFLYNNNYWSVFAETEIDNYVAKDFYEDNRGWIWVMLEHFKDFSDIPELKFSFLGGTLEMYNGLNWYKFDEDVAGTVPYSGQGIPRYYTNMTQDEEGNIWLGSLKGVYKFDGIEWIHFDEDDLISEKVLKLMIDYEGSIWVATEYGISYLRDDKWIDLTKKKELCGSSVYDIEMDQDGRIWAFTRNNMRFSGLNMIENGKCNCYDKHRTGLKGTIEELVWSEGEIFAYASDGVSKYDKQGLWKHFDSGDGLSESKFYKMVKDYTGQIWLASNKSLYIYIEGRWKQLREPKDWEVLTMMVDKTANVWVGTDKEGLYKYHEGIWTRYSIENGLIDNEVEKIFEDKNGNIWAITKKGISIVTGE